MRKFLQNKKAVSPQAIVGIAVSLLVAAVLVPVAMTQILGANQSGWDASLILIFGTVVPILAIIGIAIKYIPGSRKGMASTQAVVSMVVALLVFAVVMPIGLTRLVNVNVSTWDSAVGIIFVTVLPILALIGVALKFLPGSRK